MFIDSSTADAAPSYGFNSTCVLLQSVPIVNDVSSSTFITAASSPGFTIVLSCTSWSYWLYTHSLLVIFSDDNNLYNASSTSTSGISTSSIIFSGSFASLSIIGASVKRIFGAWHISSSSSFIINSLLSIIVPIIAWARSCFLHISNAFSTSDESIANTIRSCDSDNMISYGVMFSSLRGILFKSINEPLPPLSAISDRQQVSPPPPRSFTPWISSVSSSSYVASITRFLVNGSATCTAGLSSTSELLVNSSDANVTPCIPSRPVVPPIRRYTSPTIGALPYTISSFFTSPAQTTFTIGLYWKLSSNSISPPTVGTPILLP